MSEKYIMSEQQYNALDKALTKSHLCDIYEVTQEDECDYIYDVENDENMSLEDGLKEINDALCNFENYDFSEEDIEGYDSLMRLFEVYDDTVSCKDF